MLAVVFAVLLRGHVGQRVLPDVLGVAMWARRR